jgi:hypothetical protein
MLYLMILSVAQIIYRRILKWLINAELDGVWNKTVVACLKGLLRRSPKRIPNFHENFSQDSR